MPEMKWMSIEKDGYPDSDFECFVYSPSWGLGYGNYKEDSDLTTVFENGKFNLVSTPTGKMRWFVDFDMLTDEDEITHWMRVIYPEDEE